MSYSRSMYSSSSVVGGSPYRSLSSAPRFAPGSSAASVHAGPGGSGARISVSRVSSVGSGFGGGFSGGFSGVSNVSLMGGAQNEKETMQDLNDRLASYLERVRSLETANKELEVQIRQHTEKKGPAKDWSPYYKAIEDLKKQVFDSTVDNSQLVLQIDNARLAADDFRVKYEAELAIRMSVETDIGGLRKLIDDTNISRLNLENEIESLKEELIFLKKNHQDDVNELQAQIARSAVTVEVDAPKSQDLGKIMAELRAQYDGLAQKNREDVEKWYQSKVEEHTMQVNIDTQELQTSKNSVTELRRTMQSLEIELESLRNQKASLEGTLHDTEARYAMELEMLGGTAMARESELVQVRSDCQRQQQEYQALLNTKMKLEAEIHTYRRLLEGDSFDLQDAVPTVTTQTVKKVITTTQRIVDGKVVAESNDTEVLKA
ncbi:keratin, type I cytoskeletal 18-B [Xenopus laevis]|uniref:Keratin, type I cytoskeletal 18-B n=2 Tax=Xenopus laevis TaxID=8355 RepID=K118B_XENLA|nr:keratin, type I cytoskeletal 18-B [Xenopus laevis]Q7SY65.1 RecName: Full=Keratin, type I cytoskeletal 18-B; AltName: Full=Cytokeratin-18-B; Short=CK-18-B; AltName: Full=Keratin-18-B; Short=K18-B [Xenopus laevis]AAH54993.1 Krt18-prov protein [Xenopus laevis]